MKINNSIVKKKKRIKKFIPKKTVTSTACSVYGPTESDIQIKNRNYDRTLFDQPSGGLLLLQGAVVVDVRGMMGAWNGFTWIEKRPQPG